MLQGVHISGWLCADMDDRERVLIQAIDIFLGVVATYHEQLVIISYNYRPWRDGL